MASPAKHGPEVQGRERCRELLMGRTVPVQGLDWLLDEGTDNQLLLFLASNYAADGSDRQLVLTVLGWLVDPVKLDGVWSYLRRRPDGRVRAAEVLSSTYNPFDRMSLLTIAHAARATGDDEVFEAARLVFSGWAALDALFGFEARGPGRHASRLYWQVITPGNRSGAPMTGFRTGYAYTMRGESPPAWCHEDQRFADDWPALSLHLELLAELGADDTMLPPVACDELYIHRWVEGWSMDARGLPLIVSSSRKRDLIGWVTVDNVGNVSFAEKAAGMPLPEPLVVLGGDRGWQSNPRARGGTVTPPVEPPADDPGPDDDAIQAMTLEQLAKAPPPWARGQFALGMEERRRELAAYIISECERLGPKFRAGLRRP